MNWNMDTLRIGLLAAILMIGGNGPTCGATIVSLDGQDWRVAADPNNRGRDEAWWKDPVRAAQQARVPGIFQESLPGYHGVAWYWLAFRVPENPYPGGRCLIRFHAVDYLANVWVNDTAVGSHEGGETPFVLDITAAVQSGKTNRLAVRVLNPKAEPIDGIVLSEIPHRNRVAAGIGVGGSYNGGGITEPVEVFWKPSIRIEDVYVRPDWQSGEVQVQVTLTNSGAVVPDGRLEFSITPTFATERVASLEQRQEIATGRSQIECRLMVPAHRWWSLETPNLYRLSTRVVADQETVKDETATRFGFRDLRVVKGYFHLNGQRIFLRSSHTGNHFPVGGIVPPSTAPDLMRKDLIYMKASGFNTVRFIAGMAHPEQLELCDELGLMVYEENLAAWLLADSPKMAERFDTSLREMILRDRNHPSVVIFGLVNEMSNGPMVQHAQGSLPLLRSLDDSRLVLQQSGRWDGQYNIGSICNPGSTQWEYAWGVESPEYRGTARSGPWGGYFEGAGDAHVYPSTPQSPATDAGIRQLGRESKPVFLSEYGIGSLMNAIRELRFYEQNGANPDSDDVKFFQQTEAKFRGDWTRFGMDGVYAFPEEMLRASQQLHCRQRQLGFSLIRSNPKICGFNLTGLLDHGYTGEGLWTFWREFKPGIMDTLQEGWAPLRWCLFASPMHSYTGRPIKLEIMLANENALAPGQYPAWLRVLGPTGVAWEKRLDVVIPTPAHGEDGPLAVSVFSEMVSIPGPTGRYTLAATLERGGAPSAGRLEFYLTDPPTPENSLRVVSAGLPPAVETWLRSHGISATAIEHASREQRQVILVGGATIGRTDWLDLLTRIAQGSRAVFLDPGVFQKEKDPVGWLPLKNRGQLTRFHDWLYHKECVAGRHELFRKLSPAGIMDWDYYGPLISSRFLEGGDAPDETAAAAFALCHSSRPDGYAAGVMLGAYRLGAGKFIINTFQLLENIDKHPAADQLLLNLAQDRTSAEVLPPAPLPADFQATVQALGY